ncbi:tRNA (adenosine(37)-N6)-threonylcarbamoyltransferase complex transferase subunit TsaD [Advenella sp. S44]|uniref:tRNA (adenosine(37)-N6)-threonylcarbamoyltransferase complex transferase subunit TsaD n=1 Tax=Advenella sp. S44 TaxID=1982755 RepID=UPI000C2B0993|nr:tRNA (adenosine(37)-N6)-threonylcarbamoyltransferase complex transferase subunit TsaD [Advenella sp. S44]PJX23760.1 tRNA (adenosine(37)-N6)-threonylcarbamoyltransferase complex transferase subunit TsaD [Advenella sp. S44]
MIILGIESSCDETGVALVSTQSGLLAHALHSQIAMHQAYGGVVPELASRDHIRRVLPLTREVLRHAKLTLEDIDAVAYTAGPGLAGALLVGASVARALAWSLNIPTIPIHHLEGHLLSPMLAEAVPDFPYVALLVSGGHTQLMHVKAIGQYELLGETLDDAAGEAFDKSAKLMGLPYPGGPALAALADKGNPKAYDLPRPMMHSGDLDFSFSGLKTAVLTTLRKLEQQGPLNDKQRQDLAASVQSAIVQVLGYKAMKAVKASGSNRLVVAGGVGANRQLREYLTGQMQKHKGEVFFPPLALCTDNGAMIAHAAAERIKAGLVDKMHRPDDAAVHPRWDLADISV